jgi:membrane protease YdiL (CAAX protease family)
MNQENRKISFLGVASSQLIIVAIGLGLISQENVVWQVWGFSPWVDILLALMAAFLTYGFMYFLYLYGGAFSKRLVADVQKITLYFSGYSWFKIGCVALLAGVGEELLFRVGLQALLTNYVSIYLAIFIPALVFGLLHFLSWPYFISATLMGLVFGVVYHFTQSVMLVIVWHAVYDLIALGVIIKYPSVMGLSAQADN